ncbi:MAG: hypothetical protein FJ128_08150 [Deltaproteobacteria bacterium]|nr:hypothetical protein [Deltaproteobacteria bacterium]
MPDIQTKPEEKPEKREKPLPLVLEIIPGQAGEGLVVVMEPGSYEGSTLKELCDQTLKRSDFSIEERQVLEDIQRQLDGGKLLCQGRDTNEPPHNFGTVEETAAGEAYLYVPVRAIKPQEGGLPWSGDL